jgi:hypothetical protein
MNGVIPMDSAARFALTRYVGTYDPLPFDEHATLTWPDVVDLVAGGTAPKIERIKTRVLYMTSGLLSDGQLTPHAQEQYNERFNVNITFGRARSLASCKGPTRLMLFDIDGVAKSAFDEVLSTLRGAELNYLIFSSHSHGSPEKPGYRFRVVLPLSEDVGPRQYQSIHCALRQDLFACVGSKFDKGAKSLTQQQGTWATARERAHLAFKHCRVDGGCLDVSYWLKRAVTLGVDAKEYDSSEIVVPRYRSPAELTGIAQKLGYALEMIPSRTRYFQHLLSFLKATEVSFGDVAFELFHGWAWADPEHQAAQEAKRDAYKCEVAWPRAQPSMPADAGIGSVYKLARQCAVSAVETDLGLTKEASKKALTYLAANHPNTYQSVKAQVQAHNAARKQQSSNNQGARA